MQAGGEAARQAANQETFMGTWCLRSGGSASCSQERSIGEQRAGQSPQARRRRVGRAAEQRQRKRGSNGKAKAKPTEGARKPGHCSGNLSCGGPVVVRNPAGAALAYRLPEFKPCFLIWQAHWVLRRPRVEYLRLQGRSILDSDWG